ncbi:MAG: energy transducer TonB, partial [Terriglobales bacterium]
VAVMVAALQLGPPLPLNPAREMTYFKVQPLLTYVPPASRMITFQPVPRRPRPRFIPLPPHPTPVRLPAPMPAATPTRRSAPLAALAPKPAFVRPRRPPLPPTPAPVQLGRFGNPAGLDPPPDPKRSDIAPRLGSFGQAARGDPAPAPALALEAAGFGSPGVVATSGSGSDPGTVRASGFGPAASGTGFTPPGSAPPPVQTGDFATPTPPPAAAAASVVTAVPAFVPPQILSWPRPAYTAAAAAHKIEGGVTLQVRLQADGRVAVLRVVHGLGYGLEQSAIAAARGVRFRPARRNGQPVNWTVLLHIRFQLAY